MSESVAAAASDPKPIATTDDGYLSQEDEVFDGNDIENNEGKVYEESLDLDLGQSSRQIWLVRLPMFLAEKWRDRNSLHGQELGKIRINKNGSQIKLMLNENDNDAIPHEYDLELTKKVVENEFIFTEQNLKKYQQRERELAADPEKQRQAYLKKQEREEELKKKQQQQKRKNNRRRFNHRVMTDRDGRDRYIPYVKTIPKKTAITGTVCHECQVMPSMNDPNYHKIVEARRNIVKSNNKEKITTLDETVGVTMSHTGMSMKSDTSNFLKVGREKAKSNVKSIRMPKKEILDYLFKLFDEYDYWSLKGLKERTRQPEAHLKECLDKVASLVKKGPYAFKYTLRPEYKKLKEEERKATLGELADDQTGDSQQNSDGTNNGENENENEEIDDEIEMEDVV
ncbi:similar to Saccharomyces cerevisiae YGR005C TFG2 TFIIF (Transcription Factor II) middle subunit [Maudiozyma barnettii]|uniref:Transcription initiation factor IIF subunit beta n=1 Tax=Maudiozyma barnettii TaxID=61262 RepID=A0A8H2VJ64_9SACH|nr:transcription factor IIF subunit TFG2 [Kazachstania barnettii]CAB4256721.1 similar to Saccharomyces cerevisiae YGR005C TFG2 TFIIF (Transcription Factor II) middle subunit [Kazachstania barnettii]CAD1785377.1 similar to Saccharomyces cerevisiae YGR005C TFG2 TFIIF (Transcription Factor II) middle subunit [Kazachstania barnettii]